MAKQAAATKELVVKEEQAIAVSTGAPRGFENFKAEDLILPRLRLLQGTSKAVKDRLGHVGDFQESLTGEILGEELEVVFLTFKNGAVFFRQGEGMVCKSSDSITSIHGAKCIECPFGQFWGKKWEDNQPPECASTREFVALVMDTQTPLVVSFMKSSYKIGKQLISMAKFTGKDLFARTYKISSEMKPSEKGDYASYKITPGKYLNQEDFDVAEGWFNNLAKANIVVAEDEELDPSVATKPATFTPEDEVIPF